MRILLTATLVLLSLACGTTRFVVAPTGEPSTQMAERPAASVTENVILVSIDGLRPDAIKVFSPPTLSRLLAEGGYSLSATTILPSKTLPSHTSMLTGEPPERHGVLWNNAFEDAGGTLEIPTIFSTARAHGYRTAAFFSKSKFSHLQVPGTLDYSQAPGGWFGRWSAAETVRDVEAHLAIAQPNLLFVHLTDPDAEGHSHGWMSAGYGEGVVRADAALARLMNAADRTYGAGAYTLIVTADHGGSGRGHGSDDPSDVTIPWIVWGRGVAPGAITAAVHTIDTASTVLYLLGLDAQAKWTGVPVRSAFAAGN